MDEEKKRRLESVIVFDGDCAICSGFVRTSIALLEGSTTGFIASGSEFGQKILTRLSLPGQPSSVYLIKSGSVLEKSDAVFDLCLCFRKPYRWLRVLKVIPAGIRDWIYDGIAHVRRKFSGKNPGSCYFSPSDQKFLIDTNNCNWAELEELLKK